MEGQETTPKKQLTYIQQEWLKKEIRNPVQRLFKSFLTRIYV